MGPTIPTYNPDTEPTTPTLPSTISTTVLIETTTLVCPCTPGGPVTDYCPNYAPPAGPATLIINIRPPTAPVTDPVCTATLTGCREYRVATGPGMCSDNGAIYAPTDVRAVLPCNPDTGIFGAGLGSYDCKSL